jgi:hypothetical protein
MEVRCGGVVAKDSMMHQGAGFQSISPKTMKRMKRTKMMKTGQKKRGRSVSVAKSRATGLISV